jgi:hypothetical protein
VADLTLEVAQSHVAAPHQTGHSRIDAPPPTRPRARKYDPHQSRDAQGQWTRMTALAERHPLVAKNYARHSGTEMGSIGAHTSDVIREWKTQLSSDVLAGISERFGSDVDALMETVIPLHDIGKADALDVGDKHKQHEYTTPILQDVLRKEGFSEQDITLATELTSHDLIGPLMRYSRPHVSQEEVAQILTEKATKVGMSVQDFVTLQLAYYQADVAAYPYITQFMEQDPSGRWTFEHSPKIAALVALKKPVQSSAKKFADVFKFDEAQHPRDKEGQFTEAGALEAGAKTAEKDTLEGGGGPERAKWWKLTQAAMAANDEFFDAKIVHHQTVARLEKLHGAAARRFDPEAIERLTKDPDYLASKKRLHEAEQAMLAAEAAIKRQDPAMRVEVVTNLVTPVALRLGIDPGIIKVVDKDPPEFDVGGKHFVEGGHYNPADRLIEINARNVPYGDSIGVKGVAAHEISHAIYHALKSEAEREFERYLMKATTPGGEHHTPWFHERFVSDTTTTTHRVLRPEFREEMEKEFPASTVLARLSGGDLFTGLSNAMIEEDGHSAYAKSYWDPAAVKRRGYEPAINETVAEITRWMTYPQGWEEPVTPSEFSPWVKLTQEMHQWYTTGSDLRKAGVARIRAAYAKKFASPPEA